MTDYRHNWRDGYHPWLSTPGAIRPWGMDVPALGPVQGGAEWAACQTQVIAWPWAADVAGVKYDQDNIVGVRTRFWGVDENNDPGDRDWWVAVPKVLGEEYTPRGRSHVQPMIYDHLGDDPMQGVVEVEGFSYSIRPVRWRTPTGQYPSDLNDEGYLWVPQNLNQQTIHYGQAVDEDTGGILPSDGSFSEAANSGVATVYSGPGCAFMSLVGPTLIRGWGGINVGRKTGFRGGKARIGFFSDSPYPCGVHNSGTVRLVIGYYDGDFDSGALPDNILYDQTFNVTGELSTIFDDIGAGGNPYWARRIQQEITLPAMLVPTTDGTPKNFAIWYGPVIAGTGGIVLREVHLSPRTDVPLWYWASQRNRVAPGGIILPP